MVCNARGDYPVKQPEMTTCFFHTPNKTSSYFYLTFGQKDGLRKDGWYLVRANSYYEARQLVIKFFGTKWSMLYPDYDFKREYFPDGQLGVIG